jgi:hypothetical protein
MEQFDINCTYLTTRRAQSTQRLEKKRPLLERSGPSMTALTEDTLKRIDEIATPQDKMHADMAIRHVDALLSSPPIIYNAPKGGVVIEHRHNGQILTLIIEHELGLIIRCADGFITNDQFEITQNSIKELLACYARELKLLDSSPGSMDRAAVEPNR